MFAYLSGIYMHAQQNFNISINTKFHLTFFSHRIYFISQYQGFYFSFYQLIFFYCILSKSIMKNFHLIVTVVIINFIFFQNKMYIVLLLNNQTQYTCLHLLYVRHLGCLCIYKCFPAKLQYQHKQENYNKF